MKRMINNLSIGDKVYICNGLYKNEWGTIVDYDGEYYDVAIWGDSDAVLVFEPEELELMIE